MTIFQVMIENRHYDVEAIPFTTAEKALAYAREYYEQFSVDGQGDDVGIQDTPEGWLFYATYSTEGDSVWVVE